MSSLMFSSIDSDRSAEKVEGITEELLANLWRNVLEIEHVGPNDNFFALGGHSLLATLLVSRIRETFSVDLPLGLLFEQQTISEQAIVVEQAREKGRFDDLPITPVTRDKPILLSYAQQRMWFLNQFMGPNAVYNMPMIFHLTANADISAMCQSLEQLVSRHEALRTRFVPWEDSAKQIVEPNAPVVEVEVVSNSIEIDTISAGERSHKFDLAKEKLCRIRLLKNKENNEHVLLITMHHSIGDAWSLKIIFEELVTLYKGYKSGRSEELEKLDIQYADYAHWQRQWLTGDVLHRQLGYWKEQLNGMPALLNLPTDRPRPEQQTYRGSVIGIEFDPDLSEQLQHFSHENNVTLFMTLLSGVGVLLNRYSGQSDIAIGTPIANRTRSEVEKVVGFFVNALVMRCDFNNNPSFVELVNQVREMALQSYQHQDIPFEQLVDELNPHRDLSHSPLFQVMFALQNVPDNSDMLDDLDVVPVTIEQQAEADAEYLRQEGVARFDLTISLQETESGISGFIEYNTDLFDEETIKRMSADYLRLLQQLVDTPKVKVHEVEFVSRKVVEQQVLRWRAIEDADIARRSLYQIFEEHVNSVSPTVIVCSGSEHCHYEELNGRANQLAHQLIKRGISKNEAVGVILDDSIHSIVSMLAIMKTGGYCLFIESDISRLRVNHIVDEVGARILLAPQSNKYDELPTDLIANDDVSLSMTCFDYQSDLSSEDEVAYAYAINDGQGRGISIKYITHSELNRFIEPVNLRTLDEKSLVKSIGYESYIIDLWNMLLSDSSVITLPSIKDYSNEHEGLLFDSQKEHYVLGKNRELLPLGAVGELYLGTSVSESSNKEYVRWQLSKLIEHPFSKSTELKLYPTGQSARFLSSGELQLVKQNHIEESLCISEGNSVSTERLLKKHELVKDVVSCFVENEGLYQSFVCYVVINGEENSSETKQLSAILFKYLRQASLSVSLPMEMVFVAEIPLLGNGKVDFSAMPSPYAHKSEEAKPHGEYEESLAAIWCQVLGRENVSCSDSFFTAGGNSLLATKLMSRIKEQFDIEMPVSSVFELQTIRALAQMLEEILHDKQVALANRNLRSERFRKNEELLSDYEGTLEEGEI